jgi:hypothetical protein
MFSSKASEIGSRSPIIHPDSSAASRCRGSESVSPPWTLAVERTIIEPFTTEKEDFAFFSKAFLDIENDLSLVTVCQ